MPDQHQKTAVVALGGNAITRPGVPDTIANQFAHTRQSLVGIIELIRDGYNLAITHGNGPQVGNALLRVELARGKAPILPLGICVADTEGGMGYMIEQSLQNGLIRQGINRDVITIVTQVVVDRNDPSLANPSKFVGQFYTEAEADRMRAESGWTVKRDGDRGWRRVVGSPKPLTIINSKTIQNLVESGVVVIAAGGGGIPVYVEDDGTYEGVDAVVDKDWASTVLAKNINAEQLIFLTEAPKVCLNFGKPNEMPLDRMMLAEARKYLAEGHFPPGSMGPKIEGAIHFLEQGGHRVLVSAIPEVKLAMHGRAGTEIVPD
jgi:carbamate kinase